MEEIKQKYYRRHKDKPVASKNICSIGANGYLYISTNAMKYFSLYEKKSLSILKGKKGIYIYFFTHELGGQKTDFLDGDRKFVGVKKMLNYHNIPYKENTRYKMKRVYLDDNNIIKLLKIQY
jgi:hypothetical protein